VAKELDLLDDSSETEVGSYFVSNYPPFSAWSGDCLSQAKRALAVPPGAPDGGSDRKTPLGLYLHIPFCRKRCTFCYFRVYTDKNAADVRRYLDALATEIELYSRQPATAGRDLEFVYFGGGTPSFLSADQLESLVERIAKDWTWQNAREVTFECEPGTLQKAKLEAIRRIGTTRLSLGVEHFDDEVLAHNGRAHKSAEVFKAFAWAREVGFPEINIDLLAGMVGDTEAKWKRTVEEALKLDPDSVTIYQMEIPSNSRIAADVRGGRSTVPIADWPTKRAWMDYAFKQFEQAGYRVSSAFTAVKPRVGQPEDTFVYRDLVWHGADMIGAGVASFSHIAGVHFQNHADWDGYVDSLDSGALPLARGFVPTPHQRMIREFILQLKQGGVRGEYFRRKFGVEVAEVFQEAMISLVRDEFALISGDDLTLTRAGLLRADGLLPRFYEPQFQNGKTQ